jgi:hypothetical protein
VLVATEDEYRAYREVIAAGIGTLRPGIVVTAIGLDRLEGELERLDPQVVVCSRPGGSAEAEGRLAWVELSLDPTGPTKISFGGRRSESTNPTLETLLAVIDEAEEPLRTWGWPEGKIP